MNVNAMLRSIPAEQFLEWVAYDALEPFGEWRDDWRSAEIVTMIANVNRDTKKRKKPYQASDFLVKFGEKEAPKARQTPKEQLSVAKMIAGAFNTTRRKKRP